MTSFTHSAVRVEHLTARAEDAALENVSLSAEKGSIYAILGSRNAPSLLLRCLAGRHKTTEGQISILGGGASDRWRLRGRRVFIGRGAKLDADSILRRRTELVLIDSPPDLSPALRALAGQGTAIVLATDLVALAKEAADRIGLLGRGRMVAEGSLAELSTRFRRIRYSNRLTETRTEFGTELDEFDAVKVQVRGWGITALVSNFNEAAFERFRQSDGVENAVAEAMTLEELYAELVEGRR